jgi:hypothetical protein
VFLFEQIWLSKLSRKARSNVGTLIEDAYALDLRAPTPVRRGAAQQQTVDKATKRGGGRRRVLLLTEPQASLLAGVSLFVNARVRQVLFEADLQLTGKVSMSAQHLALDVGLPHTDTARGGGDFANVLKVRLGLGATDVSSRGSSVGRGADARRRVPRDERLHWRRRRLAARAGSR